jgi:hypothetical protein
MYVDTQIKFDNLKLVLFAKILLHFLKLKEMFE